MAEIQSWRSEFGLSHTQETRQSFLGDSVQLELNAWVFQSPMRTDVPLDHELLPTGSGVSWSLLFFEASGSETAQTPPPHHPFGPHGIPHRRQKWLTRICDQRCISLGLAGLAI